MPYSDIDDDGRLILLRERVTGREAKRLAALPRLVSVQFDAPLAPDSFDHLERHLFSVRPEVALRAYAHYSRVCDLSFVERVPSVTRFLADCLIRATGVEHVTRLRRLRELAIGIYSLTDFDFLEGVPGDLEVLRLGETESKRPSVAGLVRFTRLRSLLVRGHTKGLAAVGELMSLTQLRLAQLRSPDLGFLGRLVGLRDLEISLGSIRDLSAVGDLPALEKLELDWIRNVEDLGFLGRLTTLRRLRLARLARVRRLPDFRPLVNLTDLEVTKMSALEDVAPIGRAPALRRLLLGSMKQFQPEDVVPVLAAPCLEEALVGFGSARRNNAFADLAEARGIRGFRGWPMAER